MKSTHIPIGSTAPDFSFGDDCALSGRLADFKGWGVVLVFFRGHWCQSCRRQLAQLKSAADTIRSLGSELVVVSADAEAPVTSAAPSGGREFPIVVDAELRIIDQYGVRDVDDADGRQIARPAVFILDSTGVVRFCHVGTHRQDRPALGSILLAVEAIANPSVPSAVPGT